MLFVVRRQSEVLEAEKAKERTYCDGIMFSFDTPGVEMSCSSFKEKEEMWKFLGVEKSFENALIFEVVFCED